MGSGDPAKGGAGASAADDRPLTGQGATIERSSGDDDIDNAAAAIAEMSGEPAPKAKPSGKKAKPSRDEEDDETGDEEIDELDELEREEEDEDDPDDEDEKPAPKKKPAKAKERDDARRTKADADYSRRDEDADADDDEEDDESDEEGDEDEEDDEESTVDRLLKRHKRTIRDFDPRDEDRDSLRRRNDDRPADRRSDQDQDDEDRDEDDDARNASPRRGDSDRSPATRKALITDEELADLEEDIGSPKLSKVLKAVNKRHNAELTKLDAYTRKLEQHLGEVVKHLRDQNKRQTLDVARQVKDFIKTKAAEGYSDVFGKSGTTRTPKQEQATAYIIRVASRIRHDALNDPDEPEHISIADALETAFRGVYGKRIEQAAKLKGRQETEAVIRRRHGKLDLTPAASGRFRLGRGGEEADSLVGLDPETASAAKAIEQFEASGGGKKRRSA